MFLTNVMYETEIKLLHGLKWSYH